MTVSDTRDVVMISTGVAAEVIVAYLERFSDLNVVGFAVDRAYMPEGDVLGRPVVPWEDIEAEYPADQVRLIGPPTFARLNTFRRDRYLQGKAMGYGFASFIHPNSVVMTEDIGDHVIILDTCTIQPFTRVGNNVVIWSASVVAHHCVIGDHSFLSSQVGIAGSTEIGEECYLAGQVGIAHKRRVGARCAIMNAAVVKDDLPDGSVMVGPSITPKSYDSSRIMHML
ncbi:acetyltransferase [Marinibacterium profundimaris]|uniref:acetyltransferase n=1 Tax=Marinibacterium profundimaris TaxID=1679460 RepID=UPI000B51FB10|nr:acetyltransferase [Marinibacterium profundimaris]